MSTKSWFPNHASDNFHNYVMILEQLACEVDEMEPS